MTTPDTNLDDTLPERRQHPLRATLSRLMHHRLFVLGLVLSGAVLIVAICSAVIGGRPIRVALRTQ